MTEIPEIHDGDKLRIVYEGIATEITADRIYIKTEGFNYATHMPLAQAKSIQILARGNPANDPIGTIRSHIYIKLHQKVSFCWWNLSEQRWVNSEDVISHPITASIPVSQDNKLKRTVINSIDERHPDHDKKWIDQHGSEWSHSEYPDGWGYASNIDGDSGLWQRVGAWRKVKQDYLSSFPWYLKEK